jgi:hypothetical protein
MNIPVLDGNQIYGSTLPWQLGWTCQVDVTSSIVTATGGTYAEKAPEKSEEDSKSKKSRKKA